MAATPKLTKLVADGSAHRELDKFVSAMIEYFPHVTENDVIGQIKAIHKEDVKLEKCGMSPHFGYKGYDLSTAFLAFLNLVPDVSSRPWERNPLDFTYSVFQAAEDFQQYLQHHRNYGDSFFGMKDYFSRITRAGKVTDDFESCFIAAHTGNHHLSAKAVWEEAKRLFPHYFDSQGELVENDPFPGFAYRECAAVVNNESRVRAALAICSYEVNKNGHLEFDNIHRPAPVKDSPEYYIAKAVGYVYKKIMENMVMYSDLPWGRTHHREHLVALKNHINDSFNR